MSKATLSSRLNDTLAERNREDRLERLGPVCWTSRNFDKCLIVFWVSLNPTRQVYEGGSKGVIRAKEVEMKTGGGEVQNEEEGFLVIAMQALCNAFIF
jgi:hypothetical protein